MHFNFSILSTLKAISLTVFFILVVGTQTSAADLPISEDSVWQRAGDKYNIYPLLLYAVSLKESRRLWQDGQVRPWPYALNINDERQIFDSIDVAKQELEAYLQSGNSNVGVGAMQINLAYHPVEDPSTLLDLETNVYMGASILSEALRSTNDIELGIGRYYTWTKEADAREYGRHVLELLGRLVLVFRSEKNGF